MLIAEVAERSGFSPATIRYYEQLDLLPEPQRTAAGYRAYEESVLARLAFIARTKMLGCSLREVAELMPAWEAGQCAPVQDRLRDLVTAKLGDTHARIALLNAFTADLRRIAAELEAHIPEGPCNSDCGCLTDSSATSTPVAQAAFASRPVACTLETAEIPARLQEWRDLVTHVVERSQIDGGVRLQLDSTTPLDRLVLLVAAEQRCCSFFTFAITVDSRGVALEVQAPAEGQAMVGSLFTAPSPGGDDGGESRTGDWRPSTTR